jgi:hypothetical protein
MSTSNARLPVCFPSVAKECKTVAEPFFDCFTKNSEKNAPDDVGAGERGLNKCLKEMKLYENCMAKAEKSKPIKLTRVSTCI